ncbi:hypothetical protein DPMN_118168 [Dreissena polymorpha]|uniref:Uncharacterized protein n=1 Tax=Dreissena polymorpha TaxID=45954 RepID=A0A9D4JPZ9_DREPO|nr:hypothetical protein DPMN_118168 [Dreissena polymorpha]
MRGAILQMAKEQAHNTTVLHQIQSDISNVLTAFRVFNGTLNSILARCPTSTTEAQCKKVNDEMAKMGSAIATLNQRMTDRASVQGPTLRPDLMCENYAAQVKKTPHPLSKQTAEHSQSGLQKEKENCGSNAKPLSPKSAFNSVENKTISSHNDQNGSQIISDSNQNATNCNVSRILEETTASKPNIRINRGDNFIAARKRRNISYYIAKHRHTRNGKRYIRLFDQRPGPTLSLIKEGNRDSRRGFQ